MVQRYGKETNENNNNNNYNWWVHDNMGDYMSDNRLNDLLVVAIESDESSKIKFKWSIFLQIKDKITKCILYGIISYLFKLQNCIISL